MSNVELYFHNGLPSWLKKELEGAEYKGISKSRGYTLIKDNKILTGSDAKREIPDWDLTKSARCENQLEKGGWVRVEGSNFNGFLTAINAKHPLNSGDNRTSGLRLSNSLDRFSISKRKPFLHFYNV